MSPVRRADAIAALHRGEPVPTTKAMPAWKQSKSDLSNPNLTEAQFNAAWAKRYGSVNAMPGKWNRR